MASTVLLPALSCSPQFVACAPLVSLRGFRSPARQHSSSWHSSFCKQPAAARRTHQPHVAAAAAGWGEPEEQEEHHQARQQWTNRAASGGSSAPRQVQRALGLDYGRRVVGLAVSTMGLAPRPIQGLPGAGPHEQMQLAAAVVEVAQREGCDAVVVGLPVTQAGNLRDRSTDSQQGRRCRHFAWNLAAVAAQHRLQVFVADERGSTMEARQVMASSGRRRATASQNKDSVAAALILASFFEDQRSALLVKPGRPQRQQQQQQQQEGQQEGQRVQNNAREHEQPLQLPDANTGATV